ncbi:MAG: methyltransferase, partial [Patescibacteria group bacterium]|nr:methyltransferase [Patescibacteria group bacterium]
LDLGEKIKYVVDSATFKQGKFTPVTHVPIVAPETLTADPVAAVLVVASSYSDEVAALLKKKYVHIAHIAILRSSTLEVVK